MNRNYIPMPPTSARLRSRSVRLILLPNMHEPEKKRRFRVERRERLIRLIADLREELAHVEEELRLVPAAYMQKLDEKFFWDEVFPSLSEAGDSGITNKGLRERLARQNRHVDRARFGVFLNRMKTRGLIEIADRFSKISRWKLTELAIRVRQSGFEEEK